MPRQLLHRQLILTITTIFFYKIKNQFLQRLYNDAADYKNETSFQRSKCTERKRICEYCRILSVLCELEYKKLRWPNVNTLRNFQKLFWISACIVSSTPAWINKNINIFGDRFLSFLKNLILHLITEWICSQNDNDFFQSFKNSRISHAVLHS